MGGWKDRLNDWKEELVSTVDPVGCVYLFVH